MAISYLNLAVGIVNAGLSVASPYCDFNANLNNYSPVALIGITAITLLGIQMLQRYTQPRWGESRSGQIGRLLIHVPYVQRKFNEDINREYQKSLKTTLENWKCFGEPIKTIPNEGMGTAELGKLIRMYSDNTFKKLEGKQISGTVYSNNFIKKDLWSPFEGKNENLDYDCMEDNEYFTVMADKLKWLHTYCEYTADLWNSLHQEEFAVGDFINYQVVRMVADMYGGDLQKVMGLVTSGGTDSLMTAARIYRNWGMETRGLAPGEGVIVAPKSVHAAILKSAVAYQLKVELIDVNEEGRVDLHQLKRVMRKHKNELLFIVGSTPSYATGIVNQIQEMAKLADAYGCGMHVDSCLGGFIVNNLGQLPTEYLKMKGVTSISCDTHKNGFAPKGSSVLLMNGIGKMQALQDWNLLRSSVYCNPEWDGGVYGTPSDAGSQSCTAALKAFISMLAMGKKGYARAARKIHSHALEFAKIVRSFDGKLRLLAYPEVNVVALTIDEKLGLAKGAIYAFAHEMAERGFIFNTMPGDRIHFCVTLRYVCDSNVTEKLHKALEESLEAVQRLNQELVSKGQTFPGKAGMYCALGNALEPKAKDLSIQKFIENFFLGTHGAVEAVRAHYLALFDPYRTQGPYV